MFDLNFIAKVLGIVRKISRPYKVEMIYKYQMNPNERPIDYVKEYNASKGIYDDEEYEDDGFAEYMYGYVSYFNVKNYTVAGSKFKSHNHINALKIWAWRAKEKCHFWHLQGKKNDIRN